MKKSSNNVLYFPKPSTDPVGSVMTCQIGNQRFAIHYRVEDLPPVTAPLVMKRAVQKKARRPTQDATAPGSKKTE